MSDWTRRALGPGRPEVTCDECFELLDHFVELELGESDADTGVPGMEAHLQGCPACREEHDLLLAYASAHGR
jgi:hypothetical protein